MQETDAIVMRDVSREVPGEPGEAPARLIDGVSLGVARGALLNIVGPSGSGKSSLVRLINRLDESTSGTIEVLGKPIADWPVRKLRRRVAMAFQEPTLLGLTVRENLMLPFELCGDAPEDPRASIEESLDDAGVPRDMLDRDEAQLSVGQKQRVALARALITRPEVLLLDEPTSSLDPRTAERLLDRLAEVRARRRLTLLIVTHRLSEAQRLGGDLAVLIEGKLDARGPVERLIADPPTEASREFLLGDGP